MLTNTEIIYSGLLTSGISIPVIELEEVKSNCLVCGKPISKGTTYKKIVSSNFTDWDICKNKSGTHICKECSTVIKTKELRTNNFLATKDNLYLLKKNDLEEYLFNIDKYVSGDFVIGITRSFKKHNSYRCKANNNTNAFIIREEDKEYVFDRANMKVLYDIIWDMYLYFTKDEIQTGQYQISKIQEYGLEKFKKHESIIKQHRGTHQFDLLLYILNSEVRNEIVKERIEKQKEEKKKQKQLEKEQKKSEEEKIKGQLKLF